MVRILLHNEQDETYKVLARPDGLLTFRTRELAEDYRKHAGQLFEEEQGWRVIEVRETQFKIAVLQCNDDGEYYERVNRERYDRLSLPQESESRR